MPPRKATVDKGTTIRAASRNKQRSQPSASHTTSPFGSSSGTTLASSLSSLFSPQPHGKDAALASLLASSAKPPVKLGQAAAGLAAFGSFSQPKSQTSSVAKSLDERQKEKRKDTQVKPGALSDAAAALDDGSSSNAEKKEASASSSRQTLTDAPTTTKDRVQKASKPAAVPSIPANRKPVFRPVLASSTAVSWPEMPSAGSKVVLHTLLELLAEPEIQKSLYRDLGRRSRRSSKGADSVDQMDVDDEAEQIAPVQVLAGINSITRAVEGDIAHDMARLRSRDGKQKQDTEAPPHVQVVFVCRHDVPNPSLVAHLPMLICARNAVLHASRSDLSKGVLLFALPSGSESLLAKALNLRRASVIALTSAFADPHLTRLTSVVERETGSTSLLRAGWLETAILSATHPHHPNAPPLTQQPTAIKLLRTTQPTDLNACKAAKRSKRKQRSATWKRKKMAVQQTIKSLKAELKAGRKRRTVTRKKSTAEA